MDLTRSMRRRAARINLSIIIRRTMREAREIRTRMESNRLMERRIA